MQKIFFYCLILFAFISCNKRSPAPLDDGSTELVPGNLYVVHSMIYRDSIPWTTSNIFVIKGINDTVWIFGSGYGDFTKSCDSCNDNNYYLGKEYYGTGPAIADVAPVDSIITHLFHENRDSVILQFVVPHYHNDHINEEFIDAFYNILHYPLKSGETIWIHINDSIGALCDEPCCGTQPCPDKDNKYYGVPFMPHWKPEYKAMFKAMGNANDSCNEVIKTFTSSCGTWTITKGVAVKNGGHTDGTINLENQNLLLRIAGTKSKVQCSIPPGWTTVTVHGNTHFKHSASQ